MEDKRDDATTVEELAEDVLEGVEAAAEADAPAEAGDATEEDAKAEDAGAEDAETEAKEEPKAEPEPEPEPEDEPEPEGKDAPKGDDKPTKDKRPEKAKDDKGSHTPAKKSKKARRAEAAKAAKAEERGNYVAKAAKPGVSGGVVALVAAISLVAGLLLGHFLPLGGAGTQAAGGELAGITTLTEDQLDSAVGAFTSNGEVRQITAREVIESMSTLADYVGDDGTYAVPSASSVLSYAQNELLNDAVAAAGITVSDEDVAAYAEEVLGSGDIESIAEMYGMDVEKATEMIRDSAGVRALYDQVVSATDLEPPVAPATPEEGEEDTPTAEYAAYVMDLIGDEWDADANTWASQDGPYYAALSAESFTSDAASYNQAVSAYYVAYQVYATEYTNVTSRWTEYVNDLFSNSGVEIYSLIS